MKSTKYIFIALATAFALASCATAPTYNPVQPEISISKATLEDISAFGPTFETNPYLEPKTLLRGKLNEFFIAKLSFNLPQDSRISIIADAVALDGGNIATAYDQYGFVDFWNFLSSGNTDNPKFYKKMLAINKTCIPSMQFMQKAGQQTLYLPIVGPNPIRRPANIYIQISEGSGEPTVFEYTLE